MRRQTNGLPTGELEIGLLSKVRRNNAIRVVLFRWESTASRHQHDLGRSIARLLLLSPRPNGVCPLPVIALVKST